MPLHPHPTPFDFSSGVLGWSGMCRLLLRLSNELEAHVAGSVRVPRAPEQTRHQKSERHWGGCGTVFYRPPFALSTGSLFGPSRVLTSHQDWFGPCGPHTKQLWGSSGGHWAAR